MLEGIVVIVGMCITFTPLIFYCNYLLKHIKQKTSFDYHVEIVTDKKGKIGIAIAYIERIVLGLAITIFGLWLSDFFNSSLLGTLFLIMIVLYAFVKYVDEKNEK